MVNGERVRQVRELLGITQTELANRVQVKQATIARVEAAALVPSSGLVQSIALATGFPVEFFHKGEGPDFPLGSLLFRAHASATAKSRTEAYRYAQFAYEVAYAFSQRIELPRQKLPRLSELPNVAAAITRAQLGIGPDVPIKNLMWAAEKAGVLVLNLPIEFEHRDAFSLWLEDNGDPRPVVCLSAGKPADRRRWSVAHEIGHLVMHNPLRGELATIEQQANSFAAELLLPEAAMRRVITPPVSILSLSRLKPIWKVAIQALIRRAHDLRIITQRQYTYLFEQIGVRGWRLEEPNFNLVAEKPRALRKMAEMLYGAPINYGQLARDLSLPISWIKSLLEVYAEGGEVTRKKKPVLVSLKPKLSSLFEEAERRSHR